MLYSFDELKLIPKKYGIYVIHRSSDDKQYVGKGKLDKRLQMHKNYAMKRSLYLPIYTDMYVEGIDAFYIEIVYIQEVHNDSELLKIEKETIAERIKFTSLYNRIGLPQTSSSQQKRSSTHKVNTSYFLVRYNGQEARGTHIIPKNLSGIYKIYRPTDPEKVYIGKTVDLRNRCSVHLYAVRKVGDQEKPLYKDMHIYGIDQFCFEVIEACAEELLLEHERYWIQKYNAILSGYNDRLPQTREELIKAVNESLAQGESVRQIAKACDASLNTIRRIKEQGAWLQFATEEALVKKGRTYNENQIRAVRLARARGRTYQEIMEQFDLTYKAVDGILHNKGWVDVKIDELMIEKIRNIKSNKTNEERITIKRMLFSSVDLSEVSAYSGYTKEYLAMILRGKYWTDIYVEEEETYQAKETHPTSKEVAYIKYLVSQQIGTDCELAHQYHTNRVVIRMIRCGKKWNDITPQIPENVEQLCRTLKKRQADPRKLTQQEVAHIKYLLQQGSKVQDLAHMYGVPHSAISKIKAGVCWSSVSPCASAITQLSLFD
jgi:transposase